MTATQSLYEQIGGEAAVNAAVDVFYRKVLADDRISRFFDHVDMDRQIAKQKGFLTMAFGGPVSYTFSGVLRPQNQHMQDGAGLRAQRNAEGST